MMATVTTIQGVATEEIRLGDVVSINVDGKTGKTTVTPLLTCNDCASYSVSSVPVGFEDYEHEPECAEDLDFIGNHSDCPKFKRRKVY
jgi:hypothetical protein